MAEIISPPNNLSIETGINQEFVGIIEDRVPKTIDSFREIVRKPKFICAIQDSLKRPAFKNQSTVISELDLLSELLNRYQSQSDNFSVRVITFNQENGVLRVNIGDDSRKALDENGENQLSFSFKDPTNSDNYNMEIFSTSLSRKSPHHILTRINNYEKPSIQINSSYVYQDGSGKNKVDPHAGIVYNLFKGSISPFGVYYDSAKTAPVYIPIANTISPDQFETLKNFVQSSKRK